MPTSIDIYNPDFVDLLQKVNPTNLLDVGPGWGRMGHLTKSSLPNCICDAVEVDSSYIEQYNLRQIYSEVYNDDIKNFCLKNSQMRYDIVLFNDILEHLFRSEALDVLDFILYRAKYIIVQWPNDYLQDTWEGHESEVHKSNFTLRDFLNHSFDVLKYRKKYYNEAGVSLNYCVLRGYKNQTDIAV
jgi:trans-aconitate methyltransferase